MSYYNGRQYTDFRGINLKAGNGILRFVAPDVTPTTTTGELLLYVDSSNNLIYNNGSAAVTLGAAGGGGGAASTWDAIYAGDKTLSIGSGTLTFAGNSADAANVLTLTNIAGSSGAAIQVTNATTSNPDIKGTSGNWQVLGTGAGTLASLTLSGSGGSTVQTITAGDVAFSDGSLAIIDADNAATFSVTNDTATTSSVFVWAGSGAFSGNTTSSFFTLTPSGLTSGTAFYLPVAALTTGKALHIVANAYTDGLVFNLTSSSTVATSTGRLFNLAHTAAANVSHIIAEMATAANDETVLLRLTASDILALGKVLHINASSMTTGTGIDLASLDALTTGIGISLASSSASIDTGSLLRISTATTAAVATNGIVSIRATGAYTSTANVGLLDVQSSGLVGTGTLVDFKTSSASQLTNTILNVEQSGTTTGYTGTMVRIKSTSTTGAATIVSLLADGITSGGTAFDLSVDALTTGVGLNIANSGGAMTSGSLLKIAAQGTGAIATNGIVSFTHTGAFTSTTAVDGGFVEVKAASTTAGTIVNVVGAGLTTGIGLQLSNGTSGMTSGSLLRVTASGTGTVATNGIVSITHAGIFVSTSNTGVLDVRASAMVGTASNGTLVNFMTTAAAQIDTTVLNVENSGFTTGYTGSMLRIKSPTTTGACKVVDLIADGITSGGIAMKISVAALTTGDGLVIDNGTAATTTGSLLKVTAGGTGAVSSDGLVSFQHSGVYTSTTVGFVNVSASATTGGTVMTVVGAAVTDGTGFQISNASITTGKHFNILGAAGASMFSVSVSGATVIAGVALGTAALTLTAGDLVVSSGKITVAGGILSSAPTGSGIGYATGAGATVTQLTNRSTGVTINNLCGKIQTDTTSLAAGASAEFTVTNSTVAIGDVVVVSQRSGSSNVAGVAGVTVVEVVTVAAGSFIISVNNQSTTTAETGAIIINFAVIKAVTA